MLFISSFCLHLVIRTNGFFLKANLGGTLCLHSLAEKPGLQEVGGSWC